MGSREEGSSIAVLTAPLIRSYLAIYAERSFTNSNLWMWLGVPEIQSREINIMSARTRVSPRGKPSSV